MTATTSRERPEKSLMGQDGIPGVAGGRGWRVGEKREGTAWWPAVDISESSDAYRVAVEVPGINADEIEISIADGRLTIQGERHAGLEASGEKIHRSERGFGVFRRSLPLPSSHVAEDKVQASMGDGVLEILIPKATEAQATPIRVRVGRGDAVLAPVSPGPPASVDA
jgi:HSP20 family molecular chaperone IbpA